MLVIVILSLLDVGAATRYARRTAGPFVLCCGGAAGGSTSAPPAPPLQHPWNVQSLRFACQRFRCNYNAV